MSRRLHSYVGVLILFAVSFCVLHWVYGYVIIFQSRSNDCFFLFGRSFLFEFLDHPGGLLCYASRFLGQFYHYRWLGALIVSACIASFGVVFHRIVVKLGGAAHLPWTLFPCVLLLALHASPLCVLHDTLGLTVSCGAFLGYVSLRANLPRSCYALAAGPILYFAIGVHVWLFITWLLAFEWSTRPLRANLVFKTGYLFFSVAVPLIAWRWWFLIPLWSALTCPFMFGSPFRSGSTAVSFSSFVVDGVLAVSVLACLLLVALWDRLLARTRLAAFWRAQRNRRRLAMAASASALMLLLYVARSDASLATVVACEQLYKQRQWDDLLEQTRAARQADLRLQFMTNFALCQKGKLLDEMFRYPQSWGTRGLVLNFSGKAGLSLAEDDTSRGMYNSDLFYEMGHVNAAFRHAYNQIWAAGTTYEALERMAQCCAVNGNDALAIKYLNLLDKTLFHQRFARRYKAILADPVAAEREFGERRKRLPLVDHNMFGHPATPLLTMFETRPDNRLAFDYLMAWMLLDKTDRALETIAVNAEHFRGAGYHSIPAHCQEAMLIREGARDTPVDLAGHHYDAAIAERVNGFLQDLSAHPDRQEALGEFRVRSRDTYLFYYFFVTPPAPQRQGMPMSGGVGGTVRVE